MRSADADSFHDMQCIHPQQETRVASGDPGLLHPVQNGSVLGGSVLDGSVPGSCVPNSRSTVRVRPAPGSSG
ncbi:hypothetical protein GCM10007061_12210 [Kocuria marina]|nr:hypothetical protein GCM10007061_12210 [Kocuria marina]